MGKDFKIFFRTREREEEVMPALSAAPEIYILPNPLKDLSISFYFFPHVRKKCLPTDRGKASEWFG